MRAVIQRVLNASVTLVDSGEVVSSIGHGLCVLVGISRNDTKKDVEYIVRKILNTRIFGDEDGKRWTKSVKDCEGEILCVSQVTLYHSFKGNKLDFHHAMSPDPGQTFYNEFLDYLKSQYNADRIQDGKFGAHMLVNIQNDGPVTIVIESPSDSKDVKSGPDVEKLLSKDAKSGPDVERSSPKDAKSGPDVERSSPKDAKTGPDADRNLHQT